MYTEKNSTYLGDSVILCWGAKVHVISMFSCVNIWWIPLGLSDENSNKKFGYTNPTIFRNQSVNLIF